MNREVRLFLGHVSASGRRSRTFLGSFDGACAGTEISFSSISGGRLEPGFSPWEAPAAFGTEAFDGQGARTGCKVVYLKEGVPYIDRTYHVKEQEHWLAGYSLAGLFDLWSAYECDIFSGIACCSGSLWFKDWDIYMREHTLKRKCSVYLSLGGKVRKDEECGNGNCGRPHQGTRKISCWKIHLPSG